MRLIDANALVESILEERAKIPLTVPTAPYEIVKEKPYEHGNSMRGGIRKALRCVANAPTVEAAPVVHGRKVWLDQPQKVLLDSKCENCNSLMLSTDRFCPQCGAKMDLE